MSKKAIELLEEILEPLDACEPQCKLNLNPEKIRQALAILKKPKCKTCGDTGQVGEEEYYQGRSVGWKVCPDCQQPNGRLEYICPKCGKKFPKYMGEEFRGHVTLCQQLKETKDQQPSSEFTAKIKKRWLAEAPHTDSTLDYAICAIIGLCDRLDTSEQQPSSKHTNSEFIEGARALLRQGVNDEQWEFATLLRKACNRLCTSGEQRKDLLEACKEALSLVESDYRGRSDWVGPGVTLGPKLEAVIAKAEKEG